MEVEMVSSLIDLERKGWNAAMVKNIFLSHKADVILGIPINSHLLNDSLIWAWTPNGKFNVRSTHQVARKYGEKRETNKWKVGDVQMGRR